MKTRTIIIVLLLLAVGFYAYGQSTGTDDSSLDDLSDLSSDDSSSDDLLDGDLGDDVKALNLPSAAQQAATDGSVSPLVQAWGDIINQVESGGSATSLSARNNNPGNLVYNGALAVYDTAYSGWTDLFGDLEAKLTLYPQYTLAQIMERYAPAPDGSALTKGNNPLAYAQSVATYLANIFSAPITTSTTLSQLQQLTAGA